MLKLKTDIIQLLRQSGYSTYKIRQQHIFAESTVQGFRTGQIPSLNVINKVCELAGCQPGDLLEYVE